MDIHNYDTYYLCPRCLNTVRDLDHDECAHCKGAEVTIDSVRGRGRGSVLIAALGISLTLAACDSPPQENASSETATSTSPSPTLATEPSDPGSASKITPPTPQEEEPVVLPELEREPIDAALVAPRLELSPKAEGAEPESPIDLTELQVIQNERDLRLRPRPRKHDTPKPLYGMSP